MLTKIKNGENTNNVMREPNYTNFISINFQTTALLLVIFVYKTYTLNNTIKF